MQHETGTVGLDRALEATLAMLRTRHREIASIAIAGDFLSIRPRNLASGEALAQSLGLTGALDHHQTIPPITEWTGERNGLEVHVRACLRAPLATIS